ncbi:MAG: methylated-DNA--[Erysipelotrichaceae bacterium]|nr:methylated-DNA--[protein]-cysteine S-methyltransferase [Erysipelotrichaceae bacterium]
MNYLSTYSSPLGEIRLLADEKDLYGLWFSDRKRAPFDTVGLSEKDLPVFRKTKEWLDHYFSGRDPGALPPLQITGSAFQQAVFSELLHIPYGRSRSYGEIAKSLEKKTGKRVSAQAVGQACGRNPLLLLIPCHRVITVKGGLGGYAGGIWRKEWLLRQESIPFIK